MEEILASIRRIIADDEGAPTLRRRDDADGSAPTQIAYAAPALDRHEAPAAETRPEPPASADIRPLRLAPREADPAPVAETSYREPEMTAEDVSFDADVESYIEPAAEEASPPLMSPDAASSIAAHFETLATSMMINDSGILREYAQDMMRPMLKQWLDDNLPVIVERLVRAEIERVARGGRR